MSKFSQILEHAAATVEDITFFFFCFDLNSFAFLHAIFCCWQSNRIHNTSNLNCQTLPLSNHLTKVTLVCSSEILSKLKKVFYFVAAFTNTFNGFWLTFTCRLLQSFVINYLTDQWHNVAMTDTLSFPLNKKTNNNNKPKINTIWSKSLRANKIYWFLNSFLHLFEKLLKWIQ